MVCAPVPFPCPELSLLLHGGGRVLIEMDNQKREMCLFIYKLLSLIFTRILVFKNRSSFQGPAWAVAGTELRRSRSRGCCVADACGSSEQGAHAELLLSLTFLPASGGCVRNHLTYVWLQTGRRKHFLEIFVVQNKIESC